MQTNPMQISPMCFSKQLKRLFMQRGGFSLERWDREKGELISLWHDELDGKYNDELWELTVDKLIYSPNVEIKEAKFIPKFTEVEGAYRRAKAESNAGQIEYCGVCVQGKIFFRGMALTVDEIRDVVGCCAKCAPEMKGYQTIDPSKLRRDVSRNLWHPMAIKFAGENESVASFNDPDVKVGMTPVTHKPTMQEIDSLGSRAAKRMAVEESAPTF